MDRIKLVFDDISCCWDVSYPSCSINFSNDFYFVREQKNNLKEYEKLLRKIIKKYADSQLDAYNHLGSFLKKQNRINEGRLYLSRAYIIAKQALSEEYHKSKHKIIHKTIQNLQFLRTFHFLGLDFEENGFYNLAEECYTFLLKCCADDNFGIRYLLSTLYVKMEKYDLYFKHIKKYDDTENIELALVEFNNKNYDSATEIILHYQKHRPFIINEIIKEYHSEPITSAWESGYSEYNREDDAYVYFAHNKDLWNKYPDFINFLKMTIQK